MSKKTSVAVPVTIINNCAIGNLEPKKSKDKALIGEIIETSTSPPTPKHKCFDVLLGRRKAVKKKAERIKIMADIMILSMNSYIPPSMMYDEKVLKWHCLTTAFNAKPRAWAMPKLAQCICDFDVILHRADRSIDRINDVNPPAIVEFQRFMIAVYKEAEVAKFEQLTSSRTKLGEQKGSKKLQDNFDMTELDNNSFDVDNCAYCKHRFVVPHGLDIHEITRYNSKVGKKHSHEMLMWTNLPTQKRGPKPKAGKSLSQHLACMCIRMNCLSKTSGSGCIKCKMACENAIEQGSDDRPFFDSNFQCTCEIYACNCCVVYYRHEAKRLAREKQIDLEKKK